MEHTKPWISRFFGISAAAHAGFGAWHWWFFQPGHQEAEHVLSAFSVILGLGLAIASRNPLKHWLIILLSLLGSVAMAFLLGFWIPAALLVIPSTLILNEVYEANRRRRLLASPEIQRFALRAKTQHDVSLLELSQLSPVLLVFLRHFGCTFCRQALADLKKQRRQIEADGIRIALVHMGPEGEAGDFLDRYGLSDLPRVADPRQSVYKAFGLDRGTLLQIGGLKTWIGGFQSVVLEGHRQGLTRGDSFQMPGVFLIFHGEILKSYRHQSPADRPDYVSLALNQDSPVPS